MSSRQERRRQRQLAQHGKAAKVQYKSTSVNLLEWFRRKSWDKKLPVIGILIALCALVSFWFFNLTPFVVRMLTPKPEVHIGAAFYVYERGWTVEGKTMSTLSELRNLPSNCSLWAVMGSSEKAFAQECKDSRTTVMGSDQVSI
jgi:hypothetical protein